MTSAWLPTRSTPHYQPIGGTRAIPASSYHHAPTRSNDNSDIDWIAVERAVSGDRVTLTRDETREAALLMAKAGFTERETSIRLCTYQRQICRWKAQARTQPAKTQEDTPVDTSHSTADWRHRAACRNEDPERFFPVGNTGPALLQIEEAKAVCRRCPVQEQCLQWALETRQDAGVWGGLSEDERRAMKRRATRNRSRQAAA